MIFIIKSFILFIMVIHSKSGRIERMNSDKLDTISNEYQGHAGDLYDDALNGNSFHDDNHEEMETENSASQGSFMSRLKKMPAKVLNSLYNSMKELKSGMRKIFQEGKLTEGAMQSLGAILGLFKDGFINTRDLALG